MADQDVSRKLAVIVHADVAGSTALVQRDETLAHQRINAAFQRFSSIIQEYSGTVHEIRGDALVAGFARASDAVCAALSFQRSHTAHNAQLDDDIVPVVRIGIALGEEIFADDTVTGPGVVLAQRVEQLSAPGGVCVTGAIHEAIPQRLPFDQESLGEQAVKGFEEPVRVYRVALKPGAAVPAAETRTQTQPPTPPRRLLIALAIVALVVIGGMVFWLKPWAPEFEPASVQRMAFPLPDKPSIAVLPFANMSDDPKQEYFADGITEDLTTDLSKISGLFVIARNSAFTYKGKSVKVQQVAEELGVRYVLEGSVRRAGEQVRINAQLIDATTGGHLWAERYDGSLSDVFALQDQVAQNIIRELAVRLTPGDKARQAETTTDDPEAHDAFLRGWAHYVRSSAEDYAAAIPHFEEAIRLDPNYSRAHAVLASIYQVGRIRGWQAHLGLTPDDTLEQALEHLGEAMKVPTPLAHQVASSFFTREGRHDEAIAEAEHAIELDTNDPAGYFAMARALAFAGRSAEAAEFIDKAKRLNPYYPVDYDFYSGVVEFGQERFEEAAVSLENAHKLARDNPGVLMFLIASYGRLGRAADAEPAMKKLRALASTRSMEWIFSATVLDVRWWRFKREEDAERLRLGLRLAGLPEFEAEWGLARSERLSGEEIHSLVFGRTMYGHHPASGIEFTIRRNADGAFTAEGLWNDTGMSRIEDDRLCNQWSKFGASCGIIYRNPSRGAAQGNDYILIQRSGALPFSILE